MLPRILLYLWIVSFISASIFENPHVNVVKLGDRNMSGNPDYMEVIVAFDEKDTSESLLEILDGIILKYHEYFKVYLIDCTTDCPEDIRDKLPNFTLKTPAGVNPYTNEPVIYDRGYKGTVEYKPILSFILDNLNFLGEVLDQGSEESFIEETGPKVILFTDKKAVPLLFKGLNCHFRSRIDFGVVFSNTTSLLEKYSVETFPTVLMIDENTTKYEGKIEFKALSEFFENYALVDRKPLKPSKNFKPEASDNKMTLPEFPIITLNAENFDEEISRNPKVFLVHFHTLTKEASKWKDITQQYRGIVELGEFTGNSQFAKELGVKKFPSVRLFPINRKRKSFELSYESEEELKEIITRELKPDITTLMDSTISYFAAAVGDERKIGCLMLTNGSIPFAYKAIASEPQFRDLVKFGYYKQEEEIIREMFEITRFPMILVFTYDTDNESSKLLEYRGPLDDFIYLYYFIDQMAIPKFLNKKTKVNENDLADIEPFTSRNFDSECLQKSGLCVIILFNGKPDTQSSQVKTLRKIQGQMKDLPVHFGWVDGICQHELRDALGIAEGALPNLAAYIPSKMTAAQFKGKITEEDIIYFLQNTMRGKIDTFDLENPTLIKRECEMFKDSKQNGEGKKKVETEISSQNEKITTTSSPKSRPRKKKNKGERDDL